MKSLIGDAINKMCLNILKVILKLENGGEFKHIKTACFSFISPTEKLFTHSLSMLFNVSHDYSHDRTGRDRKCRPAPWHFKS